VTFSTTSVPSLWLAGTMVSVHHMALLSWQASGCASELPSPVSCLALAFALVIGTHPGNGPRHTQLMPNKAGSGSFWENSKFYRGYYCSSAIQQTEMGGGVTQPAQPQALCENHCSVAGLSCQTGKNTKEGGLKAVGGFWCIWHTLLSICPTLFSSSEPWDQQMP